MACAENKLVDCNQTHPLFAFSYHPITFNYHILETFDFKNMGNWKMKTLVHLIWNVRPKGSSSCFCELNSSWHVFPRIELWN